MQKQVYYSLAELSVRYGILTWGIAAKSQMENISNLQHRLANIVRPTIPNFQVLDE